jgi:hypothetical protein
MPPRPKDGPDVTWKHLRLSTGLECPARVSEAVELAETLGRALERDRKGSELSQLIGSLQRFRPADGNGSSLVWLSADLCLAGTVRKPTAHAVAG